MNNRNNLNQLLSQMSQQAGAGYFVRSLSEGRLSDPETVIQKIEKSRAQALILSPYTSMAEFRYFRDKTSLPIIHQVNSLAPMIPEADFYELLVTPEEIDFLQSVIAMKNLENRCYIVMKDFQPRSFLPVSDLLKQSNRPFYFEFSDYNAGLRSLSSSQVYSFIKKLAEKKIRVVNPPGRPVWDSSVPSDVELEPLSSVAFQMGGRSDRQFSVIIPTFNSKYFLLNVLRHLAKQDIPQEQYEVIVVDDGSTDGSQDYIASHFTRHQELQNLKYIYFPRPKEGEGQFFRAGISRNLGAGYAAGRYLTFLDSDILVPDNFFSDLKKHLERWDVIQNVRYHLKPSHSTEAVRFSDISLRKETFIEEEKYWRPFFECRSWHSLPAFWKYTCTYCLTVKKEDFLAVGRFRRNFVSYGFEDTDLGFRFFKAGKKFFVSRNFTIHLTKDSRPHRQILLEKTAKKFFLNNLDPAIYDHLRFYMGGEYPILRKLKNKIHSMFEIQNI